MKILVPIKRVPDPEMKIKLVDGKPDLSNANWVVNTFDEYAVEAALRLTENADTGDRIGEVVVVTLGPEDAAQQLRSALAMGADRAIHVTTDDAAIDAGVVSRALAKIVADEKPDLVLMGKQAVDGDAGQVGPMLAARLTWPQATFAAFLDLAEDKSSITVGREVDAGVEYKKLKLPGVVTVDLRIVQPKSVTNHVTPDSHEYQDGPRYASLKGIMKAKKKPMDTKALADLGIDTTVTVVDGAYELPPPRAAGEIVPDVQTLVKKLHEEAKVI
ncbi:MAG: electron transfer flavoprotein subunit beta/FixA family protein [Deltaproteobacteria bacterium]|nr:MAG: electron transfer flavoprotein subunit beta/FixA family protein [Deltaproteobacteria bacterium]